MKRMLIILTAAVAGAGCSALTEPSNTRLEIDHDKISQIEHLARQRGVSVVWIHYPTKRVSDEAPQ